MREIWEQLCNFALAWEGRTERVDRRTLKAQGINREPTIHLDPAAATMERRGVHSMRGDEYLYSPKGQGHWGIASAVIPLAILGIAYWNLSDLREQRVRLEQILS